MKNKTNDSIIKSINKVLGYDVLKTIKEQKEDSEQNLKVFLSELKMTEDELMDFKNTIAYAAYELASLDIYKEIYKELLKLSE